MTEDVQRTLGVTELLNEKIAIGKETLRKKKIAYFSKRSIKFYELFLLYLKLWIEGVIYFIVGLLLILLDLGILAGLAALLWFPWIFLIGFSLKGLKSFIPFIQNNWEDAIMLAFFVSFITSAISLFYILTKISKFDVFQKFIRNPRKASLEKCKLNLKNASIPDLGLEEITRLEKDIKKLETEKREYILSHEIKKSENIQSPENKECPMCAETVKAKAIICRICNHKFEPDIIG